MPWWHIRFLREKNSETERIFFFFIYDWQNSVDEGESSRWWVCAKLLNGFQSTKGLFLNVSILFSAKLLDEKYKGLKIFTVSVMSVWKKTILCDFFFSICRKRVLWLREKGPKAVCSVLRFLGHIIIQRAVNWVTNHWF